MKRSRYILTSFMTKEDVFILDKTYKKFYDYYPAKMERGEGKSTRRYYKGSMIVFQVASARRYGLSKDDEGESTSSSNTIKKKNKLRNKHN